MTYRLIRSATLLTLIAVVLSAGMVRADDEEEGEDKIWTVDFAKAKETASIDDKSILMEFTGSDWCPPCIALHDEVLVTDQFKTEVPKEFVLVKLDNPRDKSKQSEEEIAQYRELSTQYKVSGVPTVILADTEGRPYAKMVGYGKGTGPEKFISQLMEKKDILTKRNEAMAKAGQAEGVEKAKLLHEALQAVGDEELVVSTYGDVVDQIIELDAGNEAGLKEDYEAKLLASKINSRLQEIQMEGRANPEAGSAAIDELIADFDLTGETLQQALYTKGAMLFSSDKEASKEALMAAQKAAPDSQMATRIDQILKANFQDEEGDDK